MAYQTATIIFLAVIDTINRNNIEEAVAIFIEKLRGSVTESSTIESVYQEFYDYVTNEVLPNADNHQVQIEFLLDFMNQIEIIKEDNALGRSTDIIDTLNTLDEMQTPADVDRAIQIIEKQIETDYLSGIPVLQTRNKIIDFLLNNLLRKDTVGLISMHFIFRLNSIKTLNGSSFISKLLYGVKELEIDPDGAGELTLHEPLNENKLNNSILETLAHELRTSSNLTDLIKLLSTTNFGMSFLKIMTPILLKNKSFTEKELSEIYQFCLDTMNKPLLMIIAHKENLSIDEAKLTQLINCPDDLSKKLNAILIQMKLGFAEFHANDESAAKYILAAIRADKLSTYNFLPTLFNIADFNEYMETIIKLKGPAKESFIIMCPHWTAGQVEIKSNGDICIFIADSLGVDNTHKSLFEMQFTSTEFVRLCTDRNVTLYQALNKRQRDDVSCRVYALDDIRHFFTMELYMTEGGLFNYLDKNKVNPPTTINEHFQIYDSNIPDTLLRTMQSRKVIDLVHNEKVNKKGETAAISINRDFQLNPQSERIENARLMNKYQKMILRFENKMEHILESKNPNQAFSQFKTMANEHTLAGFKARYETQSLIQATTMAKRTLDEAKKDTSSSHGYDDLMNTPDI